MNPLRYLLCSLLIGLSLEAAPLRPDVDYFPSVPHAVIYRNWDIVPHERIAAVLGTDAKTISRAGREMGLTAPAKLSAEELQRNVEMVLRRNWPLLPRTQIEQMLGFTPAQFDDALSKEIFLRALLAGQPSGITTERWVEPDEKTKERVKWFARHLREHMQNVSSAKEEPRLSYTNELYRAHNRIELIPGTQPKQGDADLRKGWSIALPSNATIFLKEAASDFASYCQQVQRTKKINVGEDATKSTRAIRLLKEGSSAVESYALNINPEAIEIRSSDDLGLSRGLLELERRMAERGGPFLASTHETNTPTFNPRCVFGYSSLLTDVLGQNVIDAFPDGYLNELRHQDADGIWIYALMQDLVPSPVFEGMGVGGERRLDNLRAIVNRASKYGLKVYVYFNEPRGQTLAFYNKYPDVKGQPEGNTAALCTSTEAVQRHLRGSFEKLFREVPGLGGVFLITASENLSNCYSHAYRNPVACPRCSKRKPADVIAEAIRFMAEGVWAANPKAKFVVWDWSWHSAVGPEVPEEIIPQLPKGVALMADFERGTQIIRGGIPMSVEEYSISVVGPSPRAKLRSEQAKKFGYDFYAKVQLSSTWECGTVPFIPVPNLLSRKATAMRKIGVTGAMATWSIGSYPSPNTEAFSIQQWNPSLSEENVLRRIAAKRYGPAAVDPAVRGWTKISAAFSEEYPFSVSPYSAPLQHGPSLAWYRHDIPAPYGHATLFNCKDDWRNWSPPYPPELMTKLLRHLCERWDDGLKDLEQTIAKAPGDRRRTAERDYGVSWMVNYYYRAYANALDFYKARDSKNLPEMKRIAADEIRHTEQALRYVRADSRLGWEAELQYFYRPLDVIERLISLDAVVDDF